MTTESMPSPPITFTSADGALNSNGFPAQARLITRLLQQFAHGTLQIRFPDGQTAVFGHGAPAVSLVVKEWNTFDAALRSGDIGFAEAFIAGHWTTDDLTGLLTLLVRNRASIEPVIYGTWWGSLLYRLRHLFNRNSRTGSRKNVHAHYDIGNDFYRLWLDPSMTYSSALFNNGSSDNLCDAQLAKYRRIVEALQIKPNDHVLEIGCGWGGFAEVAASEASARVTGLTLSTEQLEFATDRLAKAGVGRQATLRLQDYRDVQGQFDAIASIEMFEAVGERYWSDYFDCIARNLKQGGRACIQTIVIDDSLFARYRRGTDFIQQYIFPGGMLPSPTVFKQHAARHGLRVVDEFVFGLDYAATLAQWRLAFNARRACVRAQGFDDRFLRTWDFYLAYCEAGFLAGSTDVMQFTLQKD